MYLCNTVKGYNPKTKFFDMKFTLHGRIGLIGRLINNIQNTENVSLSNGGLRPSG